MAGLTSSRMTPLDALRMATLATEVEEWRDAAITARRLLARAQTRLGQHHRDVDTARAGLAEATARLGRRGGGQPTEDTVEATLALLDSWSLVLQTLRRVELATAQ